MKPNYELTIYHKETKERTKAGVAWVNPDDSINIKLNPGVSLVYSDVLKYTLWPINVTSAGDVGIETLKKKKKGPIMTTDIQTPYQAESDEVPF